MVRSLEGKHPNYYESLLQLRDVTAEVIDFTEDEIEQIHLPVSKHKKVTGGMDYYCSDNNLTRALGKTLQDRFGGELKITATLHTKKNDKDLYRTTVLFREAHFRKDDKVKYYGEEYVIKRMSKDIFLQNTKTGEKLHLKYKDMNLIKKSID